MKKGSIEDIESITVRNNKFRRVIYTSKNMQLVVMSLKPGQDIGEETHEVDQFFRIEEGSGTVVIDRVKATVTEGFSIFVPAGAKHNITNTSKKPLKFYSLYGPPTHQDGIVHDSKEESDEDDETFNGETTE